jgi:transcriptional regulator with XRE-family HTH domain
MTFGEKLRSLRESAGLSQEGLARASNLSTSTISKMEQRAIDPSWTTVQALARALGVSCEAFQEDSASAPAPPPAEDLEAQTRSKKGKAAGLAGKKRKGKE